MPKFDARRFLEIAETQRATHAMLVPAQYRRLMDVPDFDRFDLKSFRVKLSTSAPFPAALKRDVLARWPGGLDRILRHDRRRRHVDAGRPRASGQAAHGRPARRGPRHPAHRRGRPRGRDRARSARWSAARAAMMNGYHNLPDKTREAEWRDAQGRRFIRTGDIGRFDEDGFLILLDRSQGHDHLRRLQRLSQRPRGRADGAHRGVLEAAVVGVASERLGRDAGRLRRAARGRDGRCGGAAELGQRPARQDAAAGRAA